MRLSPALAGALAFAAASLSACSRTSPPATGPSLLLVTLDTVRADHVGCYGRETAATPTLDRLAARGARFEHAFAVAPLTLPSHASMLTGLYPNRHGLRDNGSAPLAVSVPTLGAILRENGYEAAAFVSGAPLERRYGLDRGFEPYDDTFAGRAGTYSFAERPADRTTDAALAWLGPRLAPDRPSFALWVHYFDAHAPYAPPPPYADRFRGAPYDGEIAFVDAELGRLVGAIEKAGRLDRTIVVVIADHGEGLGEHGERTHGCLLFDSTLRVPLIAVAPGRIVAGSVRSERVSGIDVLPTVLALLDLKAPRGLDGSDRSKPGGGSTAPILAECLAPFFQYDWAPQLAARDATRGTKRTWDGAARLLATPESDPAETSRDGEASALDAAIAEYLRATARPDGRTASGSSAMLATLGYIGSSAPLPESDALSSLPSVTSRLTVLDLVNAAISERQAGRDDAAEALFEKACAADPKNPGAHFLLGTVRRERGKKISLEKEAAKRFGVMESALEALAVAADARPTDPSVVDACASVEMELSLSSTEGESKDADRSRAIMQSAEARLVRLLAARPENCDGWRLLVGVHSLASSPLHEPSRACEEVDRWLKQCPEDRTAKAIREQLGCP